jgi:hypothetical protein
LIEKGNLLEDRRGEASRFDRENAVGAEPSQSVRIQFGNERDSSIAPLDGHDVVVAWACRRVREALRSGRLVRVLPDDRLGEFPKGGATPDDAELKADLTGKEYGYNTDSAIHLEKK